MVRKTKSEAPVAAPTVTVTVQVDGVEHVDGVPVQQPLARHAAAAPLFNMRCWLVAPAVCLLSLLSSGAPDFGKPGGS